jgi:leucyl-tRNA synthetase
LDSEWDDRGIEGVYRFMNKVWNLIQDNKGKEVAVTPELEKVRNKLIYEVTDRLNAFHLNTVVSAFMEYTNSLNNLSRNAGGVDLETLKVLATLLAPFTPHMAEELWSELGQEGSVFENSWPTYDEEKMKDTEIEMPVQVNGKVKATVMISVDEDKDSVLSKAREAIVDKIAGKTVVKEIYIPKKIINIVVK